MNPLQLRTLGPLTGSAALLLGALAFQYLGGIAPCHLCLLQRWPHVAAIVIGLLILAWPRRPLALLGALVVLIGAGIAIYHVGVEQTWWAGPSSCTAPEPTTQSSGQLLDQILATPVVLCDQIAWSLWGISMAGWNAIFSLVLAWLWLRAFAAGAGNR